MDVHTLEQCWEVGLRSIYRRCRFCQNKKIIFWDEAHFDLGGYVNRQNCSILDTENPHAYIEKSTHPKQVTIWWGFWSRDRWSQWRLLSGHVEQIFVHKNWIGGYWRHLGPVFEDRIISRRADVVWPPQSCNLIPLDYYLWGAVNDKCYADKRDNSNNIIVIVRCTYVSVWLLFYSFYVNDIRSFRVTIYWTLSRGRANCSDNSILCGNLI